MHDSVAPLQVGLNVVGTFGISGAMFAAGNLIGRRWRRTMAGARARRAWGGFPHRAGLSVRSSTTAPAELPLIAEAFRRGLSRPVVSSVADKTSSDKKPGLKVSVRNNAAASRYEIAIDHEVAGVLEYRRLGTTLTLDHTEVYLQYRGRGLGDKLLRHALTDARAKKLVVEPHCSFVRTFLQRHPEFADLVS